MCLNYISGKCPKLFTRLEVLQNIVRSIALFEGIVGLIALTTKLTLMILNFESGPNSTNHTVDEETQKEMRREDVTHIVVLSIYVLQAAFALILFEGARRKVLCMLRAWLFFCFLQLLIPITMILSNVFLLKKKRVKIMLWILVIQVGIAIFHGIEAIFVLAFHQGTESKRRHSALTLYEYHKRSKEAFNTPVRKHSDASFAVQVDSDNESETSFKLDHS